ncbi:uncharacterized protein BCR38DRAFT_444175 [Pseudomassariella vexata]|uniref:Pentatricopeptide repeat domain-containing protein n=1 Tax=Pseudomassariella vexata TaxID=1141098 RepID=A0A1Y2DLN9_9PEZI|nr:uncharacterized protein BCR38DRAFT_444175 [Pseudomassariella vexata]ORY60177.1 hypothetical protein BCR38DRAFT_444175 [Pseudomassariella vexata]
MPPSKSLLLEIGSRDFICRSCISSLRRTALPRRWEIRRASQTAQATQAAAPPRSKPQPVDDAERLRTLKALGLLKEQDKDVTVNYFDQGKDGKLRRLRGEEEFADVLNGGDFEQDLKAMEESFGHATKFFDSVKVQDEEEGIDKPRRKPGVRESEVDTEADLMDDILDEDEEYSSALPSISNKEVRPKLKPTIAELNQRLQAAARRLASGKKIREQTVRDVWSSYSRARRELAHTWHSVPTAVWDLLWNLLAVDKPFNTNRMHHILILSRDLGAAGYKLDDGQQLLAIEAMFLDGRAKEAIESHRKSVTTLGAKPETFLEYWQLGLRMYCLTADLERAERVLNKLLDSPYPTDPRVMLAFIRVLAAKTPGTDEKAYKAYRRLRELLGDSMVIEDYDEIITYFLVANRTEQALWIFVEMMTRGSIVLRKRDKLPPSVANPFFFGKWIKRLVLSGDTNGAYNVLVLMKQKGISPRPMQINPLIGSLLRTGTADNVARAEDIAWAMINHRIQFVKRREREYSDPVEYIRFHLVGDGWAKANLETFSLLAENYRERGIHVKMEELWEAFRGAALAPDAFLLNQLLMSYLQAGQGTNVARMCRNLTTEYKIEPDPWTFMTLWQALPINRQHRVRESELPGELVKSRQLFAEMVAYAPAFQEEGMSIDLAKKILHTFRLIGDKIGMLVAYRAIRQVFKLKNAEPMVLEMVYGAMDIEKSARTHKGRQRLTLSAHRIEHYLSHRLQELIKVGEVPAADDLPPQVKTEEMSNFLELHLESEIANIPDVEELFKQAAQAMGVYHP